MSQKTPKLFSFSESNKKSKMEKNSGDTDSAESSSEIHESHKGTRKISKANKWKKRLNPLKFLNQKEKKRVSFEVPPPQQPSAGPLETHQEREFNNIPLQHAFTIDSSLITKKKLKNIFSKKSSPGKEKDRNFNHIPLERFKTIEPPFKSSLEYRTSKSIEEQRHVIIHSLQGQSLLLEHTKSSIVYSTRGQGDDNGEGVDMEDEDDQAERNAHTAPPDFYHKKEEAKQSALLNLWEKNESVEEFSKSMNVQPKNRKVIK